MEPSEGAFRVLITESTPYVAIADLASGLTKQADALDGPAAEAVRDVVGQLLLMALVALQRSDV